MLRDLNGTRAVSNWLNFNKFVLQCQQWYLLYKYNCWFQSYGNTPAALYNHYPIVWTVKHSVFGTGVVGCSLAWVTIARDAEPNYPFFPVVQFRRIRAGY